MIVALESKHFQKIVGGISVPNTADRAPSGDVSKSDVGTILSVGSLFAGLTPAGLLGRTVIFAAGAVGMLMGMEGEDS